MATPHEVLTQLLSPAQGDRLQAVGASVWQALASTLERITGTAPVPREVNARLVMPDEITGEFASPHLVVPIEITTDRDQTAVAYLVVPTAISAMFLDSETDDAADQEQQTILVGTIILGQLATALNETIFVESTASLVLRVDDVLANTMPTLLAAMDEPSLVLTATLQAVSQILPVTLVLPGTFLDIIAGAMPEVAASATQATGSDFGFSLTEEELEAAELIEEGPAAEAILSRTPISTPPPPPQPMRPAPSAPEQPQYAQREPTPIASAPTAHRARFAPLPDPAPPSNRSNLDLLAGLQMNVTVELGRTELTVAEVLGLGPGSVVELDRLAGEPVDILVNDRLIARGEVVVVDENFGVRVVEVIRRGQTEELTG